MGLNDNSWIACIAVVWGASSRPQDDTGNYFALTVDASCRVVYCSRDRFGFVCLSQFNICKGVEAITVRNISRGLQGNHVGDDLPFHSILNMRRDL